MVSFAFETAGPDDGEECEGTPDLIEMINGINGGEHAAKPPALPAIAPGTMPVFGPIDQEEVSSEVDPDEEESERDDADDEDADADEIEEEDDEEEDVEFVRSQFTNCALMRQRIEDELKEIKQQEKALLKKLQRLMNRDFETETKQVSSPKNTSVDDSQPSLPFVESSPSVNPVQTKPDWFSRPASEVLDDVPGLGIKKKEALLDVFKTLGDMEDLRGEASRQFKHFAELLPHGIGKTLADQLEEAMFRGMK